MKNQRLSGSVVLGLGLMAAAAVAGFHSGATANSSHLDAKSAVIGTVDLNKVMESLVEVKERNAQINAKGTERQKVLDGLSDELKTIDADLKMLPAESKERVDKIAKGIELRKMAEAKAQIFQQLINLEKGEVLREVYKKIEDASRSLAEKEAMDLVIVDDSTMIRIPERASDQEVSLAAQTRKVLYAGKSIDLTDRIITQLNNANGAPKK